MKPEPAVPQTELRRVALETMSAAKFPMFASVDGDQPRLRPVSPVKTEEFTVFVASMRTSGKTEELERNSKVELCYLSEGHDQVRITGVAELVTEPRVRQEIWDENPLLRAYRTESTWPTARDAAAQIATLHIHPSTSRKRR